MTQKPRLRKRGTRALAGNPSHLIYIFRLSVGLVLGRPFCPNVKPCFRRPAKQTKPRAFRESLHGPVIFWRVTRPGRGRFFVPSGFFSTFCVSAFPAKRLASSPRACGGRGGAKRTLKFRESGVGISCFSSFCYSFVFPFFFLFFSPLFLFICFLFVFLGSK